MNGDLTRTERIERQVAAELDLLVGILGAVPAFGVIADEVADEAWADEAQADEAWDGLGSVTALAAEPDAEAIADLRADADADAALLAMILATGRADASAPDARADRLTLVGSGRTAHPRPSVRRRRRWWYGAAASAAIALGLAGALTLTPSSPATAGQPPMLRFTVGDAFTLLDADTADALPSAHDTLLALGDAAAATTDPPSGGDVQYVQLSAWFASRSDDGTVLEPVQRDSWLAPDGSVHAEEARYGAFDPWGDLVQPSIPPGVRTDADDIPAGSFDASLAVDASTDPTLVLTDLVGPVSIGECDGVQLSCSLSVVETTFMQYVVPSDTRAAIWRALAARTDLRLMGDVTDRLGRHGVGIGFREPVEGWATGGVFIVDPSTGELLGVERVVHMQGEEQRLAEVMAIQRSAWVAAVGDKP